MLCMILVLVTVAVDTSDVGTIPKLASGHHHDGYGSCGSHLRIARRVGQFGDADPFGFVIAVGVTPDAKHVNVAVYDHGQGFDSAH